MKNIHIIPTDKPSRLYKDDNQVLNLHTHSVLKGVFTNGIGSNQHIYITSDEEIKELTNDWFIETDTNEIYKSDWIKFRFNNGKKIILTTDQDLIKDGVQAIDDEFLEWFVKMNGCESVEIKELISRNGRINFGYQAVIPKEEPKQETLEEAALKHCDMLDKFPALINPLFSFKEGAKWQQDNSNINALNFEIDALKKQIELLKYQQEKMYSEEEVKNMLVDVSNFINTKELKDISDVDFNKWIYKRDYFINFLFDFDMPTDTANEYINSLKQQP